MGKETVKLEGRNRELASEPRHARIPYAVAAKLAAGDPRRLEELLRWAAIAYVVAAAKFDAARSPSGEAGFGPAVACWTARALIQRLEGAKRRMAWERTHARIARRAEDGGAGGGGVPEPEAREDRRPDPEDAALVRRALAAMGATERAAWEARLAGADDPAVAEAMGVSRARVHEVRKRGVERARAALGVR